MPVAGLQWLPKSDILSYEEIAQIVRELAPLGLRRLRITGGEPTLRPELDLLIGMLSSIPGIEDISLSTNGVRLPELADSLKDAGLDRVNMSADSLRSDRIRSISRRNLAFDPIAAATAAENAGLSPIKINVVVMRGINDDEISDFAVEFPSHTIDSVFCAPIDPAALNEFAICFKLIPSFHSIREPFFIEIPIICGGIHSRK